MLGWFCEVSGYPSTRMGCGASLSSLPFELENDCFLLPHQHFRRLPDRLAPGKSNQHRLPTALTCFDSISSACFRSAMMRTALKIRVSGGTDKRRVADPSSKANTMLKWFASPSALDREKEPMRQKNKLPNLSTGPATSFSSRKLVDNRTRIENSWASGWKRVGDRSLKSNTCDQGSDTPLPRRRAVSGCLQRFPGQRSFGLP